MYPIYDDCGNLSADTARAVLRELIARGDARAGVISGAIPFIARDLVDCGAADSTIKHAEKIMHEIAPALR